MRSPGLEANVDAKTVSTLFLSVRSKAHGVNLFSKALPHPDQ
jgi:hypothetical protein